MWASLNIYIYDVCAYAKPVEDPCHSSMAFFPRYSADTVRLAMANSGDTLEPANFDQSVCHWARDRAMGFTFYPWKMVLLPMENGGFSHGKW